MKRGLIGYSAFIGLFSIATIISCSGAVDTSFNNKSAYVKIVPNTPSSENEVGTELPTPIPTPVPTVEVTEIAPPPLPETTATVSAQTPEPTVVQTTTIETPEPTVATGTTIFGDSCNGKTNYTLVAHVYQLGSNTQALPDFSKMNPLFKFCPNDINVPDRDFKSGFPGVDNLVEWFGIKYDSGIMINTEGQYEFSLSSDDGSKLWIDNTLVINNDNIHGVMVKSGNISLKAGKHTLQVDYFQGPRYHIALQLLWKPPQGKIEIVPASAFVKL